MTVLKNLKAHFTLLTVFVLSTFTINANVEWKKMPNPPGTTLKYISVGNADNIWGTGNNWKIYKWNNNKWKQMPGSGLDKISAASDGTVWATASSNKSAWKWNGSRWVQIHGKQLIHISAGSSNNIWGISPDKKIWKWQNNKWNIKPGSGLDKISVASDGTIWATASSNKTIWKWNGSNGWKKMPALPNNIKHISVGSTNNIWGINEKNLIFKWQNNKWAQIPGGLKHISVGSDGEVWGMDLNNIPHRGINPETIISEKATNITLYNKWISYGGSYKKVSAKKDPVNNIVHVEGLVRRGNWGKIAVLPVGFRPTKHLVFHVNNHASISRVDVEPNGTITWRSGGKKHGLISLSGITFSTIAGTPISLNTSRWKHEPGKWGPAAYRKVGNVVYLEGDIEDKRWTGVNSPAWRHLGTLPEGSRPKKRLIFAETIHSNPQRIEICPDGQILWGGGTRTHKWISLSGITFNTEEGADLKLVNKWKLWPDTRYAKPTYRKEGNVVYVQGLIANDLFNTKPAAVLPEGYRPSKRLIFSMRSDSQARVDVDANGNIIWRAGRDKNGWLSLSGISFSTTPDTGGITLGSAKSEIVPSERAKNIDLYNGLTGYGGSYKTVSAKKGNDNIVYVEGLIRDRAWKFLNTPGTSKNPKHLATLAKGYRPTKRLVFNLNQDKYIRRIDVLPDGKIFWAGGQPKSSWLSLTGIKFSTVQGKELPLKNQWKHYDGEFGKVTFRKIGYTVFVEGIVRKGSGKHIATLPKEYRPQKQLTFNTSSDKNTIQIDVTPEGHIIWVAGKIDYDYIGLTGITFSTIEENNLVTVNNWKNTDATYIKDGNVVLVQGKIKSAKFTRNKPVATLPKKYHPSQRLIFNLTSNGNSARVDVTPQGSINWLTGINNSNWLSLSGLSFSTAANIAFTTQEEIKQKALDEAKRKTEETKRKAAEAAKKKTEEAKRKTAEVAKKKAKEAITISEKSTNIDLYNKWVSYGGSYGKVSATKTVNNIVYVEGLVKNGNWGKIAVLPPGFRPTRCLVFHVNNHANISRVNIEPNGTITWILGGKSHGWISLAGINFSTEKGSNIPLNTSRWKHEGGKWGLATHRKIGNTIYLEGSIEDKLWDSKGGVKSPAWRLLGTLPPECRPKKRLIFAETYRGNTQRIEIYPNGQIHWAAGTRTHKWISVSGITFTTEEGTNLKLVNKWKLWPDTRYAKPTYKKEGNVVYVQGLIANDLFNTKPAAVLPEGYRPSKRLIFSMRSDSQARVDVDANGNIIWRAGKDKNGWLSLSGISFPLSSESIKLITQKEKAKQKAEEAKKKELAEEAKKKELAEQAKPEYYITKAKNAAKNIRNALKVAFFKNWIKDVEFLITNAAGRSTPELDALKTLIEKINRYIPFFKYNIPQEKVAALNELLDKLDYSKVLTYVERTMGNATRTEDIFDQWIKKVSFLVKNKFSASKEELTRLSNILNKIVKYIPIFEYKIPEDKVAKLKNLTTQGEIDYQKIAAKAQADMFMAIGDTKIYSAWIKNIEYLINNMQDRTEAEIAALNKLVNNINNSIDLFLPKAQLKLRSLIEKISQLTAEKEDISKVDEEEKELEPTTVPFKDLVIKLTNEFINLNIQTSSAWLKSFEYLINNMLGKPQTELNLLEKLINKIKKYQEGFSDWLTGVFGESKSKLDELIQKATIDISVMIASANSELRHLNKDTTALAWINKFTHIVNHMTDKPEDITAFSNLVKKINTYITDYVEWAQSIAFGNANLTKLNQIMPKAKSLTTKKMDEIKSEQARAKAEAEAEAKAEKERLIVERTKPEYFINTVRDTYQRIGKAIRIKEELGPWINDVEYLVNNARKPERTKEELNLFKTLINKVQTSIRFFPQDKKAQLNKLIDQSETDFTLIAQKATTQIGAVIRDETKLDSWLENIEYLIKNKLKASKEELKELQILFKIINKNIRFFPTETQTKLKGFIAQGEVDYKKIAQTVNDNIGKAIRDEAYFKIWLTNMTYLMNNIQGRTAEEIETLKILLKNISDSIFVFPENAQYKLQEYIEKGTKLVATKPVVKEEKPIPTPEEEAEKAETQIKPISPSYKTALENAITTPALLDKEGQPGKISLYNNALSLLTADISLQERILIINNHLVKLINSILENEKTNKDTEILKKIITQLQTAQGKLSQGLIQEAEQKQINDLIAQQITRLETIIKQIEKQTSFQLFQNKINAAKTKLPYEASINEFKNILFEAATSQVKKGIYMNEVNILIDNRKPNKLKVLVDLIDYIIGSATYNPALKETFSIDDLKKLKEKASKPIAFNELIERLNSRFYKATEPEYKRKSWITLLKYIVKNIEGKPKEDIDKLSSLMNTIDGYLKFNPIWSTKFTDVEKITLKSLIANIKAAAEKTPTTTKKIEVVKSTETITTEATEVKPTVVPIQKKPASTKRHIRR